MTVEKIEIRSVVVNAKADTGRSGNVQKFVQRLGTMMTCANADVRTSQEARDIMRMNA